MWWRKSPFLPVMNCCRIPNIIVTPHIGGGTADIGDVIIPMLTEDIKALADGGAPAHVVNKEYMVH